jgi:hypothetical protein
LTKEIKQKKEISTDDFNGPKNGIHATKGGFVTLGERFAQKSIALVKATKKHANN